MRHIGLNEYASVAAPRPPTALSALLPSTSSSVGVRRPALKLPRASQRPVGPSGGRKRIGCAPAADPTATLVNATVMHDATASSHRVSGCGLDASHHRIDLSPLGPYGKAAGPCHRSVEEQSIALSAASERGFRHAKQARKEGPLGMLMLRHPSRWLARAMAGRSPCQTREIVVRWLLLQLSSRLDGVHRRTLKSAVDERLGGKLQITSFGFCDGDRSAGR